MRQFLRKKNTWIHHGLALILLLFICTPVILWASEYTLLAPISGPQGSGVTELNTVSGEGGFSRYVKTVFRIVVGMAGIITVVILIFAGIEYTVSGANEALRSSAKKRMEEALTGLILALAGYLILQTINPSLVDFELRIPRIDSNAYVPAENDVSSASSPVQLFGGNSGRGIPASQAPISDNTRTQVERRILPYVISELCKDDPSKCSSRFIEEIKSSISINKIETVAGGKIITIHATPEINEYLIGKGKTPTQGQTSYFGLTPVTGWGVQYNSEVNGWRFNDKFDD